MTKEIYLIDGSPSFIFIGINPFEYLDKVLLFFENNFAFSSKKYISGWHSTVYEYKLEELTFHIGNESDVLSITLITPITKSSIEKVSELVLTIDDFLSAETA